MKKFCKINEVNEDFENQIFLTFDIDWAIDEVLNQLLDVLEKDDVKATFFVTHETPVLERMRKNPNIELGVHPNFNPLLSGDFSYGKNYMEVIDYFSKIVPEAVSVRSHFLSQSTQILAEYSYRNFKYDSNIFLPQYSNIEIKPFDSAFKGIKRLPFFWADDVHIFMEGDGNVDTYLNSKGLKIFGFHPTHLFLNSEAPSRYQNARPYFKDFLELKKHVNHTDNGVFDFLKELIKRVKA